MPSYTRGQLRNKLTYVNVSSVPNVTVYYGFNTKNLTGLPGIAAADLTALGHLSSLPAPPVGDGGGIPSPNLIILRAQSPKPARVRKVVNRNPNASTQGTVNTFCAPLRVANALQAGWQLSKAAIRTKLTNNQRTVTGLALLTNNLVYAYPMNATDHAAYASELGLLTVASQNTPAERAMIFAGATAPRAGTCKKELTSTGGTSSITTFFSTEQDVVSAGWEIVSEEVLI